MPRLRRVEPYASPGITRQRRGRGFAYRHTDGTPVDRADRNRIADLAIPPAWNDVWIAAAPNAHILAVGVDAAGRRQYLYHPVWREQQDLEKFMRMTALAEALPGARRSARRDLELEQLVRERVLAAAFRTLDLGAIRIGSEEALATARSRGLTTLLVRNARLEGDDVVRLKFRAKGGIGQDLTLADPSLAAFVASMEGRSPSSRLYAFANGRRMRPLGPVDVNEDIRQRTGGDFTAKDFRTLRGTIAAADRLAQLGTADTRRARAASVKEAIVHASDVLGNTPAIAKASYVDPRVIEAYEHGRLVNLRGLRETALLQLLVDDASDDD
jgi:DNA topoisomerase-1